MTIWVQNEYLMITAASHNFVFFFIFLCLAAFMGHYGSHIWLSAEGQGF